MLLKHMENFVNIADIPCVDLVWHSHSEGRGFLMHHPMMSPSHGMTLAPFFLYRGMPMCNPGPCNSTLIWKKKWLGDELLEVKHDIFFT